MNSDTVNRDHLTIITGGGRGLGETIAKRMAQETAVLLVGRTESDLDRVCEEIFQSGGSASYIVGDVSKPATAKAAVLRAKNEGRIIRNLVCNAGIAKGGVFHETSRADWNKSFAVNVDGTFHFAQACLPEMMEHKGGSISIISSILGLRGAKYQTAYAATKFALNGMAQCLALEYKKHGITVVPICPGFVHSDMTERSIASAIKHKKHEDGAPYTRDDAIKFLGSTNLQRRILEPQEIAEAVAFVASQASMSVTGKPMDLTGLSDSRVLKLVNWISQEAAPARGLIVPLSGGSDSAACAILCAMAYPEKTTAVFMGPPEQLRCREFFESRVKVEYVQDVPVIGESIDVARWAKALDLSISRDAWLVGTRNHTEELIGFYSMASRLATFIPLSNVWKSEVMELCAALGVPEDVLASSRRADPDCGRPAELSEIPLEMIDMYLRVEVGELPKSALASMTPGQRQYLRRFIGQNKFKRFLPTRGPSLQYK